jgi:ankyrin repeat protein
VSARNVEAVSLLLSRGADPNARQQVGYTPLMGAAASGRRDLVNTLLDAGADPGTTAEDGKTAADVARGHGHHDLAAALDTVVR